MKMEGKIRNDNARHPETLKNTGTSVFLRSGDMSYTGSTLDHIHFHLLTGAKKRKNGTLKDNILVTLGHRSTRHSRS